MNSPVMLPIIIYPHCLECGYDLDFMHTEIKQDDPEPRIYIQVERCRVCSGELTVLG